MDLQLALISTLVRQGKEAFNKLHDAGIEPDFLMGEAKEIYQFISDFYSSYDQIPSIEVIEGKFSSKFQDDVFDSNTFLPETTEPIDFYIEELKSAKLHSFLNTKIQEINLAQNNRNPYKTLELIEDLIIRTKELALAPSAVEEMSDLGPEAIKLYERFERKETGILTPWPTLNRISSGFWEQDMVILAARSGVGKCCVQDTVITDVFTGTNRTIKQIVEDNETHSVATWSKENGIHPMLITDKVDTGYKECLEFTLRSGKKIKVTPEHPFLTAEGWKRADLLCTATLVATPAKMLFPFRPIITTDNVIKQQAEDFASFNKSYVENHLKMDLNEFPFTLRKTDLKLYLEIVFNKTPNIAVFGFTYVFCSNKLASSLQHLLLRFGIQSQVANAYEGSNSYLNINPAQFNIFIDTFNIKLNKYDLDLILDSQIDFNDNFDFKNDIFWDEIIEIKNIGVQKVYDLTIEPTHCFVANDIIVHNTWSMLLLAQYAFEVQKKRILFISPEMPRERLALRFNAIKYKLPYDDVIKGHLDEFQKRKLKEGIESTLGRKGFGVVASKNFDYKVSSLAAAMARYKPDAVYIDGVYLLQANGVNRNDQAANLMNDIKKLAIRFNIPIIISTQMNKEVDTTKEKTVKDKGIALTDVANWNNSMSFGLFQDEDMKAQHILEIKVLKAREGTPESIKVWWDFNSMNFDEINIDKKDPKQSLANIIDDPFARATVPYIIDTSNAINNNDYTESPF